jgi:hypothetical protein
MILTGVDNTKRVSIDYNLLLKKWKLTDKEGKSIYVIPSDKCLVKVEKLPEGVKKKDLEKYLKTKYGKFLFDYTLRGNEYILVLVRDFNSCVYWRTAPDSYIEAMKEAEREHKGLWRVKPKVMHCLCY